MPNEAEAHLAVPRLSRMLAEIGAAAGGPEQINDNPTTNPARRLEHSLQQLGQRAYGKVLDGPNILAKAGLAPVRAACPHFGEWLTWLEGLA